MPRDDVDDDLPRRPRDDNAGLPRRSPRRADDAAGASPAKKNRNVGIVLIVLGGVFLLCCGGFVVGGYYFWTRVGSTAREEVDTRNNLTEIGQAFQNHEARNGFLPNNSYDPKGRPLLSWRVHLLPYLGEQALYDQFNLNESWDSATNKPLIAKMPRVYGSSSANARAGEGSTYYRGFSHTGAIFEKPRNPGVAERITIAQIPDGPANTIFVIESGGAVEWTRPLDIDWSPGLPRPPIGSSPDLPYCLVLMGDGSVRRLRKDVGDVTLRNLIDRRDGMVIPAGWEQ